MRGNLNQTSAALASKRHENQRRLGILALLGALVVVVIAVALMVPGISLTKGELTAADTDASTVAAIEAQAEEEAAAEEAEADAEEAEAADDAADDAAATQAEADEPEATEPEAKADDESAAEDTPSKSDDADEAAAADADDESADEDATEESKEDKDSDKDAFKAGKLTASEGAYKVTVEYDADAKIPAGATLKVKELDEDSKAFKEAREAVVDQKKADDSDFDEETMGMAAVDVSFVDKDGEEVEPQGRVNVTMKLNELPAAAGVLEDTLQVQHLDESTGDTVVETVCAGTEDGIEVGKSTAKAEFFVDSFSTFVLTWDDGSALIHYGYLNTETHEFVDFTDPDKVATLDTSVASVNLANTFEGYSYIGCEYKASPTTDQYDMTSSILTRKDGGWQITHKTSNEEDAETITENVANGSDIYVIYGAKSSHEPTPAGAEVPKPITEKNVQVNPDGTATVTLDITGTKVTETQQTGANVLIVLDTTYSMASSMTGATNRFEAARSAILTLIDTLDCGTNDIELALVEFNSVGSIKYDWTKDYRTVRNYVANTTQHASGPTGTNWESGLYYARQVLNNKDSDNTYVIFLTDGEPNRRGTTTSTNAGTSTAISYALTQAQAITGTAKTFLYGVFCGSASGYNNLANMISNASGSGTINGTDANGIKEAFKNIASTIVSNLGASGVSVDDGVTDLSSVSATVHGTAGGYKYYYGDKSSNNWTEWTAANGAPGATYSEDNGVTWDLSNVGPLAAGTTYRVQFTVWPSQEALDLIANLNNGTVEYDKLSDDVKAQISGDKTSGYTLKTNTHLNTTYSFKGDTYTDPITPLPSGDMPLASEQMTVEKQFAHSINAQDPFTSIMFYLKVDGKYYQKDGTTSATLDESKAYELPVNTSNDWKNNVYIAPGFMEGEEVLEPGHKYTLEEKVLVGSEYEYEFTPQTVRPMIINGTMTYLVLVDKYNAPGKNSVPADAKTYTIGDETYYVASENNGSLIGTNRKTAELDITKVVKTNGILSAEQEAEETFTYRVTLNIPDDTDPAGIVGYEYVYRPNQDNAYFLYGYHHYAEEGMPVPTAFDDDIARLGDNKYRAWNTLVYRDLVEWDTVDGKIVSKRDADGNIIWKVPASGGFHTVTYDMTLKQNEVIRFTNLPTGTTYTIQEIYANKYPADNVGGETAGRTPVSDASNIEAEGYSITRVQKTAGTVSKTVVDNDTVSGTIEDLDQRYYNQFTNTMTKAVDVNIAGTKKLKGYDWSGESYHFTLATTGSNPMPPAATGKTEFDLTAATGNADQTDTFGRLRFTADDTYTYTVSETDAGTLQVVNGKAIQFGDAQTVTIKVVEENGELKVDSVTGAEWDEDAKTATATITNTAPTTEVSATKQWQDASGKEIEAPVGATVTFTLYVDGEKSDQSVVLDGTPDENGESADWTATFSDLQQYKVVDDATQKIKYTIGETTPYAGYELITTDPVEDGGTIINRQGTFWVQFVKAGEDDNTRLSGAEFTASFLDGGASLESGEDGILVAGAGADADKVFNLAIQESAYTLTETVAPAGYNKLTSNVYVKVTSNGVSWTIGDDAASAKHADEAAGTKDDPYVVIINNTAGTEIPSTGGPGTILFTLAGLMLVAAAGAVFLMGRRPQMGGIR